MTDRDEASRYYNIAEALLMPHLPGRANKIVYKDDDGACSYAELADKANRIANLLVALGVRREERVLLCLHDSIEWSATFLGAVKAGIIPVATNTMLTPADYDYLLRDSRAAALIVAADVLPQFEPVLEGQRHLRNVVTLGAAAGRPELRALMAAASPQFETVDTFRDEPAFWQYSSGTTGRPKGVVHLHGGLIKCAELYARDILGIREDDLIFSAARMFFGYGMGNSLAFPLAAGASAILFGGRPTPEAVGALLLRHQPTIFFGVPTLYASLLASDALPPADQLSLRLCVSAGEALPISVARRWQERTGVEIVEGLGSTEMLHMFISGRPGDVREGCAGKPVPGYEVRLVGEDGQPVAPGELGELQVSGPTSASGYWAQREKSQDTFVGRWTRSADKCVENEDGTITVTGRSDDMLKVGGIYVSPLEVEAAVVEHPSVAEAAVVGYTDADGLVKPRAFVVLHDGHDASPEAELAIKQHVKALLAPYKYPRSIRFVPALPKTSTGKIQRFKLRDQ